MCPRSKAWEAKPGTAAGTFFTSFFSYNTLKFNSANISAFEINAA
jgi:hypothetical protein